MIDIVGKRKYFYAISLILLFTGMYTLWRYDMRFSIDFQGGSLLELQTEKNASSSEIADLVKGLGYADPIVQISNDTNVLIRTKSLYPDLKLDNVTPIATGSPTAKSTTPTPSTPTTAANLLTQSPSPEPTMLPPKVLVNVALTDEEQQTIIKKVSEKFGATTKIRFESIGPIIGKEITRQTILAVLLASLFIVLYVAYAFRKVPKPASSWRFGICAIIALLHDILFILGMAALLGHFIGLEIDSLFVVALLNVMSFSVHDTIVSFDRVRENLIKMPGSSFEEIVNHSIVQTMVRSLNINLAILFTLFALYLFGAESIKNFLLILILGIATGTYSSIFTASPLLVTWNNMTKKKQ